tara:strand:- start:1086 stop:1790 length:705 start_codon:yes stop_codon:yes gene_type:complete
MRDQEIIDLQEAYMQVCQYNENTDTEDLTEAGMRYFPSSSRPPEPIKGRFKSIRRNSTTNPDKPGPYRFPLDRGVNLTNQPSNSETNQNTSTTRSARRRTRTTDLSNVQFNSYDYCDTVLAYLLDEGYAETLEAAEAIMVNMSEEWKEDIIEAAKDQSNKQIEKGVKTTYRAGNVLDNQHQGRSKGLNRLSTSEREEKTNRMRERLKARRDDLFGERNRREDEARAELKKRLGL